MSLDAPRDCVTIFAILRSFHDRGLLSTYSGHYFDSSSRHVYSARRKRPIPGYSLSYAELWARENEGVYSLDKDKVFQGKLDAFLFSRHDSLRFIREYPRWLHQVRRICPSMFGVGSYKEPTP